MANKISVVLDFVTDKANAGVKGFKQSINDADGAVGKFKAGAGAAFDSIKAHAGQMALAAGASLIAFGAKGVQAFNALALEAGKFRDTTGATLDEASRWIAVGDDIGLTGDQIGGAFNKMNVAIGAGKPLLAEYGIELKKTNDGQADANATFLNAIDVINGIKDPTKRAELAAATFGKGWTSMSELIKQGSGTIVASMAEVSDSQIIDDSEVAKAKEFRASMDKLGDSIKDLAMDFGEELTPAIAIAGDVLAEVAPIMGKVAGFVGDAFVEMVDQAYEFGQGIADVVDHLPFVDMVEPIAETLYEQQKLERGAADLVAQYAKTGMTVLEFSAHLRANGIEFAEANYAVLAYKEQLDKTNTVTGEAVDATDDLTESVDYTAAAQEAAESMIDEVNTKYGEQVQAVDEAREALEELTEKMIAAVGESFNLETSILNLESAYAAYEEKLMANVAAQNDAELSDREKAQSARDLRLAELDVAGSALETALAYAQEKGAADGSAASAQFQKEKLFELAAAFPELRGEIQTYIDKLNAVPGVISTRFEITATGATVTPHGDFIGIGGPRAAGGPVSAGVAYPVGEEGVELFVPSSNGSIIPNNALNGNGNGHSGGSPISITVNAGMGADGREIGDIIVGKIREYERRNGNGWRG